MPSRPHGNSPFSELILQWFAEHGRHDLPWQQDPTPYRVWVSEIMLQQTQVTTVIPYFLRFMDRFQSVEALAAAGQDQVLHLWTGLGYYARARNLHRAAQTIVNEHGGALPRSVEQLMTLSGIGQSTAGAIAALSMQVRAPILDGNVKRVLTRAFTVAGYPEQSAVKTQLWNLAETLTPTRQFREYTQAIMDLGAAVCTRTKPLCQSCPVQSMCQALAANNIDKFPGRKPKKKLPVKSVTMLILQNQQGEVLLQKRPATGIWGSLYSLPECESAEDRMRINNIEVVAKEGEALNMVRHSFSHYHLDIQPVRHAVHTASTIAEGGKWLWYPLDHSLEVGLAAPVKKLLSSLHVTPE